MLFCCDVSGSICVGSRFQNPFYLTRRRVFGRYTPRRIDDAIKALVSIIRTLPDNTWMTRVSLKEKARTKIGDTGLLNYALRVVENLEVGGGAVVRRMVHPDSHVMEYR